MTKLNEPAPQSNVIFRAILSQPYLLLVLAPLFWGGNVVAARLAVGQIDPYLLLTGRWIGAVLLLTMIALPHIKRDWGAIRPSIGMLFLYGALGFAAFNLLIYNAAHFTTAVNSSIEQASIPVLVLLGNFIVFRVRAKALQIIGLILTILGVMWVATHGEPQRILALDVNIGDGLVLFACILYAGYSLGLRYKPDIHWLSFIFMTAAAALIAALIFQFTLGGGLDTFITGIPEVTPLGWACIIYVMSAPSILAQLCYARGVQLIGPNRASIFINLLPVFGTILSVIIIGEKFETYHIIASVLVIGGIALSEWAVRKK